MGLDGSKIVLKNYKKEMVIKIFLLSIYLPIEQSRLHKSSN